MKTDPIDATKPKKRMKKKTKVILLISAIIIFLIIGGVFASKQKAPVLEYSSVVVEQQDLRQTVSETGAVIADTEVSYGWEIAGRVARVEKKVGDTVKQGDVIAALDDSQQRSRLSESLSRLASAQAALRLKLAGPSDAEKAQAQSVVTQSQASLDQANVDLRKITASGASAIKNAEIALSNAESTLNNSDTTTEQQIDDAYEDALQVINGAVISSLGAIATVSNIQHTYGTLVDSSSVALNLASKKSLAVEALVGAKDGGKWRTDDIVNMHGGVRGDVERILAQSTLSHESVDGLLVSAESMLQKMKSLLDEMLVALNSVSGATATEKTSVNTERSSINTELSAIINAKQAISSAKLSGVSGKDTNYYAYEKAKQDLANTKQEVTQNIAAAEATVRIREAALEQSRAAYSVLVSPPREVDIGSIRADISREQASVAQYQKEVEKTQLVALMDGVISVLESKVGETVSANQSLLTIISSALSIEVDISESDIAKVMVNDPVSITLDAFGDDVVFEGHVIRIDPAQTEISGVVYYKTDIIFDSIAAFDVRPGMTANIDILTDSLNAALVIPQRALLEKDGKQLVRVLLNKKTGDYVEREITTGMRGDNGLIAVTSGLSAGEEIITFIKEN